MLNAVLYRNSLEYLRQIQKALKILREQEIMRQVIDQLSVGILVLLVALHDLGEHIAVTFVRKRLDGLDRRERLEAELRDEPSRMLVIFFEILEAVPYIPAVNVSACFIGRSVKPSSRCR